MALIRNGVGLSGNPMGLCGTPTTYYGIRRQQWTEAGRMRSFYAGEATVVAGASIANTAARPNGYEPPYSWMLAPKGGGFSAYNTIESVGTISGNVSLGINLLSTMTSDGSITAASLSLVVSMACSMLSDCAVTADMQAIASLASSMVSSGDLAGALSAIAWMVSAMASDGTLDGSTAFGTARMEAVMTTAGGVLTAADIAAAVWADTIAVTLSASVELIRKIVGNRLEVDLTAQTLIVYDDDGVTVLRTWPLDTDGGENVATSVGVQTKRGVPV